MAIFGIASMKQASAETASARGCRVVTTRAELRACVNGWRAERHTIGFVPTMGALHAGHLSLVDAARRECSRGRGVDLRQPDTVWAGEDFERYPRNLDADVSQLAERGLDLVFAPPTQEVYRLGHATTVEVSGLTNPLEGSFRPGHFRGVTTVVLKLLNMVAPDIAFFGQKDYQQSLVVRRMVTDLDVSVAIRVCPTVREADGLAMSSRNVYLSADDRRRALVLSRSLKLACELFAAGQRDAALIKTRMKEQFDKLPGVTIDYLSLADGESLAEANEATATTVALIAARLGGVRLIDNCILGIGMK